MPDVPDVPDTAKVYLQEIRITLFASKVISRRDANKFASKFAPGESGWDQKCKKDKINLVR